MTSLIRVGLLPYFAETVERLGGDSRLVLEAADLAEATMDVADTFIPYVKYRQLLVEAVRATDYERFGLLVARRLGPASLGVVGFVMQQSANVGTAFELLARFFHLHDQHGKVTIDVVKNQMRIGYWIDDLEKPGAVEALDVAAALGHNFLTTLAGCEVVIRCFEFPYARPVDLSAYDFLCAEELVFGAQQVAFLIDRSVMNMPTISHDPQMADLLETYIKQLDSRSSDSLSDQVRQLVSELLATGECNLESAAELFQISPRTLQNRLQREGSSFQEIVEGERKRLAMKYLRTGDMPLTNIALLLGYSDSSTFSRSFRRWYQQSPSCWRKAQSYNLKLGARVGSLRQSKQIIG